VSSTTHGTLSISGASTVIYSPNANYCGTDSFTYTVVDSFGPLESNISTGTITVNCVNDTPVASDDSYTLTEDTLQTLPVLVNDSDVDNATGSLTITGLTQPATGATLSISGTNIIATPSVNYCGVTPRTFTYQLEDASGATSTSATGTFTVTCVNDTPIANNDSDATVRNTPVLVSVLANDTDVDNATGSLTITGLTNGALGTATLSGSAVLYTPNVGICGTGSFTYQVEDASGATSNTATGTITINCSNSAPTATADSAIVTEDSTNNTVNLTANDTDPDA